MFKGNDRKLILWLFTLRRPRLQVGLIAPKHLLRATVVMRAKIIKRWAIFIAVLSLIGGTGFFTQRFQVTRQAKSVDDEADTAVKKGNFAKAERLYREH